MAVASNFYYPLRVLLDTHEHDFTVTLVQGSSGALFAQAKNGAPFDVFLSADAKRPAQLFAQHLSFRPATYALGRLALYPANSALSLTQQLTEAKRIAIANPQLAPFGEAALEVLTTLSIGNFEQRLVRGNNIAQSFQFVHAGHADVGILSVSILQQAALTLKESRYSQFKILAADLHSPIIQQMVVMSHSSQVVKAKQFSAWLLSAPIQSAIKGLGYDIYSAEDL